MKNKRHQVLFGILLAVSVLMSGCSSNGLFPISYYNITNDTETIINEEYEDFNYADLPKYTGMPYIEINNNIPYFTEDELVLESFELYGELDSLGRCTSSIACLSTDTMPEENEVRGAIGHVKPTGWRTVKYDCVSGLYCLNRTHCIGWQLCNENDEVRNLVSGSRYMNLEMLEYENMVAEYIRATGNHVMYRVTPIFIDTEMLCRGLLMEGYSVEDRGAGICYCVYFYNVQPGIEFNYTTGESWYTGVFLDTDSVAVNYDAIKDNTAEQGVENTVLPLPEEGQTFVYILNHSSKKFHIETCDSVLKMKESNKEVFEGNRNYLISIGYKPCGACKP